MSVFLSPSKLQYKPGAPQQQTVVVLERDEKKESAACASTIGCFLSFFFSPFIGLTGLCCFVSNKGRGNLLVGSAVGALVAGSFILAAWFILSQNYLTEEAQALRDALEPQNNSTLAEGWYYSDSDGDHKCGELRRYQGKDCSWEEGYNNIKVTSDNLGVSLATEQIVGSFLGISLTYFALFAVYLVVGAWCLGRPKYRLKQ